ncbi:hypothetical protein CPB86DRAFT_262226 [Serendipita vermifera]|nr:hypothetical protein CPB86DRAFT_262226 [Serendipita vermifera]
MFRNKQSKDRIIVVMGAYGAGKTTFINYATGQSGKGVGHGLHPCTKDVEFTTADSSDGRSIVLVDTPGFDATTEPSVQTLSQIAEHLEKAYKKEIHIERILYLHKISDNRMAGPSLQNLELFASICHQRQVPNVTFVTTMWSHVNEELGVRREKQLCEEFWKELIDKGSKAERFKDSYESALEILGCSPEEIKARILLSTEKNHEHKHRWSLSFSKLTLRRSRTTV